ncbi:MAG: YtxH domain-containing protein [Acidobacteria bacterium]|jgi:hypothetical protein|nr:YtxH domain-containing protein [Acidobacteriota bacterium]
MKNGLTLIGGIGLGAALMFLFDPARGRRRRALIRDKAVSLSNNARKTFNKKKKDLTNRAQGLLHEAKSQFAGDNQIT